MLRENDMASDRQFGRELGVAAASLVVFIGLTALGIVDYDLVAHRIEATGFLIADRFPFLFPVLLFTAFGAWTAAIAVIFFLLLAPCGGKRLLSWLGALGILYSIAFAIAHYAGGEFDYVQPVTNRLALAALNAVYYFVVIAIQFALLAGLRFALIALARRISRGRR